MTAAVVEVRFRRDLPHGHLVGVTIPAEAGDDGASLPLHADELAYARGLGVTRRPAFLAGRLALRAALADLGIAAARALLPDDDGAPVPPPGAAISVSHKHDCAVALVARRTDGAAPERIGVDLEWPPASRVDIGARVLTATEQADVASLPPSARRRATLLRFSIKEALYKALPPAARRRMTWADVTVTPYPDGACDLVFAQGCPALEPGGLIEARHEALGGFILTSARHRMP